MKVIEEVIEGKKSLSILLIKLVEQVFQKMYQDVIVQKGCDGRRVVSFQIMFLRWSDNKNWAKGTPLVVQWLRLLASTARSIGLIPGQQTKILHTRSHNKKIEQKRKKERKKETGLREE